MSAGQNLIGREHRMCQYVQHQRCRCSAERSYQCPQCLQCTNYNRCSLDAPVSSKQNNNKLLFSSTSVMLIMSVKTGRYFFCSTIMKFLSLLFDQRICTFSASCFSTIYEVLKSPRLEVNVFTCVF